MTVSPPFNINEAIPASSDVVAQHPANARTFRDTVESWLLMLSTNYGKFIDLNLGAVGAPTGASNEVHIYHKSGNHSHIFAKVGSTTEVRLVLTDASGQLSPTYAPTNRLDVHNANVDFTITSPSGGVQQTLEFSTVVEGGSQYNTGNGKWTPTVKGLYHVTFAAMFRVENFNETTMRVGIYKNGGVEALTYAFAPNRSGTGASPGLYSLNVTALVEMNGSTDYVTFEVYGQHAANIPIEGASYATYANAELITPLA